MFEPKYCSFHFYRMDVWASTSLVIVISHYFVLEYFFVVVIVDD